MNCLGLAVQGESSIKVIYRYGIVRRERKLQGIVRYCEQQCSVMFTTSHFNLSEHTTI